MRIGVMSVFLLVVSIAGCKKDAPPAAEPARPVEPAKSEATIGAEPKAPETVKEVAPKPPEPPAEPAKPAEPPAATADDCEAAVDHLIALAKTEKSQMADMLRDGIDKEPRDKMLARCRDDEKKHPGAATCIKDATTLEAMATCSRGSPPPSDTEAPPPPAAPGDEKATREACDKAVDNLIALAKNDSTDLGKAIMKQLDDKKRDYFVLECIREEPKRPGSAKCVAGVTTLQGLQQCAVPEAVPAEPAPAPAP